MFNKSFHRFQYNSFTIIIYTSWLLYILIALGLWSKAPQYLDDLQYYVTIYVSLFLIWRFNPFRIVKFTRLDKKIAFSAGLFLLATSGLTSILTNYVSKIENVII